MFLWIVFLPLLGFLVVLLFSNKIGNKGVFIITTFSVFSSFVLSCLNIYMYIFKGYVLVYEFNISWLILEKELILNWFFLLDALSMVMCLLVSLISFIVHCYSYEYMRGDPQNSRFMSYLSLFTFFMLILLTAGNFFVFFLGWEGIGLSSFLLISFWFTRKQAVKAGIKAIIYNKIGDVGLLMGIGLIYFLVNDLNFIVLSVVMPLMQETCFSIYEYKIYMFDIISGLLFIGVIAKSAQIGLHMWLVDAMEGPTPVSALLHAATMVTAGVYMLVRLSFIFESSRYMLSIITLVGGLTAVISACIAMVQYDMKKVIAYSTCSQLGYMVFICGLSAYHVAIYHLINHGIFKALLFLTAGVIIHGMDDEQDVRKMGGLVNLMPFSYTMFLIGALSLSGFPFLTGFYSKDLILEFAYASYRLDGYVVFRFGSFTALLTTLYIFRVIFITFLGDPKGNYRNYKYVEESGNIMSFCLVILGALSVFSGYFIKDMLVGAGTNFWGMSIFFGSSGCAIIDHVDFIPLSVKSIPVFFSLFGLVMGLFVSEKITKFLKSFGNFLLFKYNYMDYFKLDRTYFFFTCLYIYKRTYIFLSMKWFFDFLVKKFMIEKIFKFSYFIVYKRIEKGIFEIYGPFGLVFIIQNYVQLYSKIQNGFLFNYLGWVFFGYVFILSYFLFIIDLNDNVYLVSPYYLSLLCFLFSFPIKDDCILNYELSNNELKEKMK